MVFLIHTYRNMFKFFPFARFPGQNVSIDSTPDSKCRTSPSPSVAVRTVHVIAVLLMLDHFFYSEFSNTALEICVGPDCYIALLMNQDVFNSLC